MKRGAGDDAAALLGDSSLRLGGPPVCGVCHAPYEGLACARCLARRAYGAFLRQQGAHLPAIVERRIQLRLRRKPSEHTAHFELFGEPTHGYCGATLTTFHERTRRYYGEANWQAGVCPGCLKVLDRLITEAAAG